MRANLVVDKEKRFYGISFECPGCASRGPGWSSLHVLRVAWNEEAEAYVIDDRNGE